MKAITGSTLTKLTPSADAGSAVASGGCGCAGLTHGGTLVFGVVVGGRWSCTTDAAEAAAARTAADGKEAAAAKERAPYWAQESLERFRSVALLLLLRLRSLPTVGQRRAAVLGSAVLGSLPTVGQRRATIGAGAGAAQAAGAAAVVLDSAVLGSVGLGNAVLGSVVLGSAVLGSVVLGNAVLGSVVLGSVVLGSAVLGSVVPGSAVLGSAVLGSVGRVGAAAIGFERARGGRCVGHLQPTSDDHLRAGRDPRRSVRRASAIVLGRCSGRRSAAAVAAAVAPSPAALAATTVMGGRNEGTCKCGSVA